MKYYTIPPSKRLSEFVRFYWVLESEHPYTHFSMADICPELLFHYKGQFDELLDNGETQKSFTAGVHGQTNLTRKFHTDQSFGMFGVYLYPQTLHLLFGISPAELTNQIPGLNELLKNEGERLEEKMVSAKDNHQRVRMAEDFIEYKLSRNYKEPLPAFYAIQTIIRIKGVVNIKQLASDYFLSERQFERQFKQFSGFSPKVFARIVRFHAALSEYGNSEKSLTEIALACGYYDQSHFIHDFKAFSGHHPKHYFSGNAPATAWRD